MRSILNTSHRDPAPQGFSQRDASLVNSDEYFPNFNITKILDWINGLKIPKKIIIVLRSYHTK